MYTYGTVNSKFVEIQPDSTNIKNDPRIYIEKWCLGQINFFHWNLIKQSYNKDMYKSDQVYNLGHII